MYYGVKVYESHLDHFMHFYSDYSVVGQQKLALINWNYRKNTIFSTLYPEKINDHASN